MKNTLKKITNTILALIFIFSSVISILTALDTKVSSASLSFALDAHKVSNSALSQTTNNDSLFFIDLSLVRVNDESIFVYDNKDSTIKIIDKATGTYRALNNHFRFYNLKDMVVYNDALLLLDGETNKFSCIFSDTLTEIDFSSQENLSTLSTTKSVKIISTSDKDYILLCPDDPTSSCFELAEISLEKQAISGTEEIDIITISNIKTFMISNTWASQNVLNSYSQIYVSIIDNDLFIMMLSNNELYSFIVDLNNISDLYSTITSVSGLNNFNNILDIAKIKLNNEKDNILIAYEDKICFYNLNVEKNISASLEKLNLEISLDSFDLTSLDTNKSTISVISNQNQELKIYDLSSENNDEFSEATIVNENISPYYYSATSIRYVITVKETALLSSPYSKDTIITVPEDAHLAIVGEGRYSNGEPIYGWQYVMYTFNNQNYYGYIDSISTNSLTETTYAKNYVTCLAHTKLYTLPSKFADDINTEIKVIKDSSRLEVLSPICDYTSLNTYYLLVKVNGDEVGFIDKSRVLSSTSVNDKIIPNATVLRNNSEIFTSTDEDKEIIIYLNKGDRVKVIGKRDTITNYTKVSFNDDEGNEYTGYIYTHNLELDTWSMLQIIGMFLVAINIILLIIIICIKNKVTR